MARAQVKQARGGGLLRAYIPEAFELRAAAVFQHVYERWAASM